MNRAKLMGHRVELREKNDMLIDKVEEKDLQLQALLCVLEKPTMTWSAVPKLWEVVTKEGANFAVVSCSRKMFQLWKKL